MIYAGNYREHLFVNPLLEDDIERIFTKDDIHPRFIHTTIFDTKEEKDDHDKFEKSLEDMNHIQQLRAMGNRARTNAKYKDMMGSTFFDSFGVDLTSNGAKQKVADYLNEIIDNAKTAPKSWIGKKIESLRSLYAKSLYSLNYTRRAGNSFLMRMYTTILSMIGNTIDWLLRKLQHFAG